MERNTINIAKDFSSKLGGRWERFGSYSGEQFYKEWLQPSFLRAKETNEQLHIYLDGASPYGSSFLDQSFGELARVYGSEDVKKTIILHTSLYEWIVKIIINELWR